MNLIELINNGCCLIKDENSHFGSSFFYKDNNKYYLVTALHVIQEGNDFIDKIILCFDKEERLLFTDDNIYYSDNCDDIVLIDIDEEIIKKHNIKCFTKDDLLSKEEAEFLKDKLFDCYAVGYPNGKAYSDNNLPLIKKGINSSLYQYDYEGEKEFALDIVTTSGSSGSPIVTFINDRLKLIGVLSETNYDFEELYIQETDESGNLINETKVSGLMFRDQMINDPNEKETKEDDLNEIGNKNIFRTKSISLFATCTKTEIIKVINLFED